jgi:hypothetical protein
MTTKLEEQLQAFRAARGAVQDCRARLAEGDMLLREARKCLRTAAARVALEEAEKQDAEELASAHKQHERFQVQLAMARRNLRAIAEKIPGLLASDVAGMCGKIELDEPAAAAALLDLVVPTLPDKL